MALNLFLSRFFSVPCRSSYTWNCLGSMSASSPSNRPRCLHTITPSKIERPISSYVTYHTSDRNSRLGISMNGFHSSVAQYRDHVPDLPGSFPVLHPAPNLRLDTEQEAEQLCFFLRKSERELLYKVLRQHHRKAGGDVEVEDEHFEVAQKVITPDQVKLLFLCNTLPFIGFGILDNLIMILAGEYIDSTMGIVFGLSTMAAAGFGNIISDIAGVGLAHYVEFAVAKFFGVRPPPLTAEQWDSSKARWTTNSGRAVGLTIGCLIGMFPLLFYDETEKMERKLQAKQHHADGESPAIASGS